MATIKEIQGVLEKHSNEKGGLVSILEEIQSVYGYLPFDVLKELSAKTGHSLVDIYGVATFYKSFRLKPRGKHLVRVCLGTACHVRGGPRIADEFKRNLKIEAGETTPDKEFTLETVNCLGACALGPIVVADGHYFSKVTPSRVKAIIKKSREGLDKIEIEGDQRVFPMEVSCPHCNHSLMDSEHLIDGYPAIRVTITFEHRHGWLLLSSLYGSYNTRAEFNIPKDSIINFFCPHCHAGLIGGSSCPECGAPMVPMIVQGGGIIQICSRSGCKGHILDLNRINFDWPASVSGKKGEGY